MNWGINCVRAPCNHASPQTCESSRFIRIILVSFTPVTECVTAASIAAQLLAERYPNLHGQTNSLARDIGLTHWSADSLGGTMYGNWFLNGLAEPWFNGRGVINYLVLGNKWNRGRVFFRYIYIQIICFSCCNWYFRKDFSGYFNF